MTTKHVLAIVTSLALSAAGAAASMPFNLSDIRIGHTATGKIAKDQSIPGKGVSGECLKFAKHLQSRFEEASVRSQVIVFQYEALAWADPEGKLSRKPGETGTHAIVVYDDGGRTYAIDNQSWMPVWMPDGSTMTIVRHFAGIGFDVQRARVIKNSSEIKLPAEANKKAVKVATTTAPRLIASR